MKKINFACIALMSMIFGIFGQSATAQTRAKDVTDFLAIMDQAYAEMDKCPTLKQADEILAGLDAKTEKFNDSKAPITEADHKALTDGYYKMIKSLSYKGVKEQGLDPTDPQIGGYLNATLGQIRDTLENGTKNATTLGQFIMMTEKVMNQ